MAAQAKDTEQERIQLKAPSETFRIREMSRKLGKLYLEGVDAGRPLRDGAGKAE